MNEVVLDSSVLLKWFDHVEERHQAQALSLRDQYEAGRLRVIAPRLLVLEVLNVAGRRWRRAGEELTAVATMLDGLGLELVDPVLVDVARWTSQGLSAYDASYVAAAEAARVQLVTDDAEILRVAPGIARPLADVA